MRRAPARRSRPSGSRTGRRARAAGHAGRDGVEPPPVEPSAQVLPDLDGRLQAHPFVQVGQLSRRLPGDDPVDHVLVRGETAQLLGEDPPARFGAEQVLAATRLERACGVPARPDEHRRQLAQVAERRQGVGEGAGLALGGPCPLEAIPDRPERLLPQRVLLRQPVTVGVVRHGHVEPQRGPVRVEAELEAVMGKVQFLQEEVPEPRPLETELGEVLRELLDHPLLHELLERPGTGAAWGEVVHGRAGEGHEEPPAPPPHLVDEVLGAVLGLVGDEGP